MFPKKIVDGVYSLRLLYRKKKHCVSMAYPVIEIFRYVLNHEMSMKLFYYPETGLLEIQPLDKEHVSRISFFDYKAPERRWVRNKDFIFSVIRDLKKSGLWDYVSNKEFLVVNSFNKKINPKKLNKTLDDLMYGSKNV